MGVVLLSAILESLKAWLSMQKVDIIRHFLGQISRDMPLKLRILQRLSIVKSIDPYEIKEWVDDVELWPELEFGDIYTYLIDGKGIYTKETLKSYKSLDAYNYYTRQVIFVMKSIF